MKSDKETMELLRSLIKEVKNEIKNKKLMVESKTPQDVFKTHEKNIKDYILDNISEVIKNAEK